MRKTYALFDFDGTLIGGDSILLFLRYAWQKKLCSTLDVLRFIAAGGLFAVKLLSPKRAKEAGLRFLKGRDRTALAAVAEDFCQSVLIPRLYTQGVEAVRRHLAAGDEALLVSASPAFYLEPLKRTLGFSEVLGTQFATDKDGRFTGEIVGLNNRGAQKTLRLQEYFMETGAELDYETSSAYGDSAHDLPMLRLCKHAYAVNPKKKMRKRLNSMDGVTVVRWKETP